ncbi:hypothetical protein E7T06_18195 [Deinococcus sp. Arct2-2]|uniref:alginate O-acetyltransferase AlgX-related protein n=1 Tax=Deinococcus sp. Arct2-2 TaxID=2568653 RepID=UPI0010A439E5|nr:hypothetical protein [Deinococcus sp. Arct2-2]THF68050.1 hypothetical protein E7T06_18195 [Deinococcus sp. Arct2-2]
MKKQIATAALSLSSLAAAQTTYCPEAVTKTNVRQSQTSWMFDMAELSSTRAVKASNIQAAQALFNKLKQAGIKVYVPLVPSRPVANPSQTTGLNFDASQARQSYQSNLAALSQLPATSINLLDPLNKTRSAKPLWFTKDLHWTGEGAGIAADVVGKIIAPSAATWPKTKFNLTSLQGGQWRQGWESAIVPVCGGKASEEATGRYTAEAQGMALLDAAPPAFALAGSSYSGLSFFDLLQAKLQLSGVDYSVSGGAGAGGLEQFLLAAGSLSELPQALIWELPDRYILQLEDTRLFRQLDGLALVNIQKVKSMSSQTQAITDLPLLYTLELQTPVQAVSLKFDNLSITKAEAQIRYADDSADKVVFDRSDRIKNDGLFAVSLSSGKTVVDITISTPKASKGTLTVAVY